jgi:hypothetical protein
LFGFWNKIMGDARYSLRQGSLQAFSTTSISMTLRAFAKSRRIGTLSRSKGDMGMRRNRIRLIVIAVLAISASLFVANPAHAAGKQTLTGEVGDAMCGKKHMEGAPAECTRACVSHGSKYALVVGDKIYTLETTEKTVLALLDQQAGKNATVTGTVNGDNIEVSMAVAAK